MSATLLVMGVHYTLRCKQFVCARRVRGGREASLSEGPPFSADHVRMIQTPRAASSANARDDVDTASQHQSEMVTIHAAASGASAGRLLQPRPFLLPLFPTWQQYEHVHVRPLQLYRHTGTLAHWHIGTLAHCTHCASNRTRKSLCLRCHHSLPLLQVFLWLGKDTAWNLLSPIMSSPPPRARARASFHRTFSNHPKCHLSPMSLIQRAAGGCRLPWQPRWSASTSSL